MKCITCSKVIGEESLYCPACGTRQKQNQNVIDNLKVESIDLNELFNKDIKFERQLESFRDSKKFHDHSGQNTSALLFSALFIAISVIFIFINVKFDEDEILSYNTFVLVSGILLVCRIVCTIWGIKISLKKKHDVSMWVVLSILLPAIALFILSREQH